eukprot:COSAG02_NODE_3932_length_6026_cov_5.753838_4_plen_127_part_00
MRVTFTHLSLFLLMFCQLRSAVVQTSTQPHAQLLALEVQCQPGLKLGNRYLEILAFQNIGRIRMDRSSSGGYGSQTAGFLKVNLSLFPIVSRYRVVRRRFSIDKVLKTNVVSAKKRAQQDCPRHCS